jgi:hypothetical protein
MQHSRSRQAKSYSFNKEIPSILWNPKAHYRVHNSFSLVSILSQMNPVNTFPDYLCKIRFNIILPHKLSLPNGPLPKDFL